MEKKKTKVLTCSLVVPQLLRFRPDFSDVGLIRRGRNNREQSVSLEHDPYMNCNSRIYNSTSCTILISRRRVSRVTLSVTHRWYVSDWPGFRREFPFLADERAGTEAHVKVSRATSSGPGGEPTLYDGTLAILWASAALCDVARTSSCAYIQRGRRKHRRRRRRQDAPARLAGKRALANANPGSPSTDRDTPELLFQQPSCSSNPTVLVALERLPATIKSMTGHLTILLALIQHRFKLVASLEKWTSRGD